MGCALAGTTGGGVSEGGDMAGTAAALALPGVVSIWKSSSSPELSILTSADFPSRAGGFALGSAVGADVCGVSTVSGIVGSTGRAFGVGIASGVSPEPASTTGR